LNCKRLFSAPSIFINKEKTNYADVKNIIKQILDVNFQCTNILSWVCAALPQRCKHSKLSALTSCPVQVMKL